MEKKELELYIHIPFCVKKCDYCDFLSFSADEQTQRSYVAALQKELVFYGAKYKGRRITTIFIGGGTPSWLREESMQAVMETVYQNFAVDGDAEITIECNPGTVTEHKFEVYRKIGINRLSIGLQSAHNDELKILGRIHTYEQFLKTYDMARKHGFTNINIDLMSSLPGQTPDIFCDSLHRVLQLKPEHISAYSLIVEENTPLYFDINGGSVLLPGEDEAFEMYEKSKEMLESLGFHRYEISNYAKEGYESRHNLNYWNNGEYVGLGLNSHSAMHIGGKWLRWANKSEFEEYLADTDEGKRPLADEPQTIERAEEMFECVMLGLRKTAGITNGEFEARFGESLFTTFSKAIAQLDENGLLIKTADGIRLNDRGLDIENLALMPFMED